MITEDYVSIEIAKLLKEKGFNVRCSSYGAYNGVHLTYRLVTTNKITDWNKHSDTTIISVPTLQMAIKWLREVHELCLFLIPATVDRTFRTGYALYPQCDNKWEWCASKNDGSKATFGCDVNKQYCDTYEQACEAAIKYCLENLL